MSNSGRGNNFTDAVLPPYLKTLAEVRDLVDKHLPTQYRHKPSWRHVSSQIAKAADGEKDLLEICFSLCLVLALEGVQSLMK
jgi:hypothetical protein